jgi:hypothetical protein
MKIILLIPCVLYVLGVVDVVDGADEHLRGSSRDLMYYGFGGDNPPPIISTPTNPTQLSTSVSFQSPDQPSQTPEDNAPVSGNDQPIQTPEDNAPVAGNPPLTSPTNPINPVQTSILGEFSSGGVINVGSLFGKPSSNTGSGSSTECESVNTKVRSELVCPEVVDPVICESGCQYGNSCKAEVAAKAGFPANRCSPN